MRILGIETTCDETSAAVLENGKDILSNVVFSQVDLHSRFHGVVPELASRAHSEKIAHVISKAISISKPKNPKKPISAVVFANGPGLPGALLVGKIAAETVARLYDVPIYGVNHLEGHLFACEFDSGKVKRPLKFPQITLIVSGGHTELWLVRDYGRYKLLGRTRDDAAGEVFDKVAKFLDLGYPGGPKIEKTALKGNENAIRFPRPYMPGGWEFSFSGLKTSVSYFLRDSDKHSKADVCASFQSAVTDVLVKKTVSAAKKFKVKHIAVGGGVAANSELRQKMNAHALENGLDAQFVQKQFCSDNAAMIAFAGYKKISILKKHPKRLQINPELRVKSWS
jgi:tRNA N6-adenosine threonylcarbamoyltransferase